MPKTANGRAATTVEVLLARTIVEVDALTANRLGIVVTRVSMKYAAHVPDDPPLRRLSASDCRLVRGNRYNRMIDGADTILHSHIVK